MAYKIQYFISWDFGLHHINDIEVNEKDFFRIIDSMSIEFLIHREWKDEDNNEVEYWITNYHGDREVIGYFCIDLSRRYERLADEYYKSLES